MKKGVKMKATGYILIACALIMTFLLFTGKVEATPTIESLIKYWGGTGIVLLFGNAGKRIIGGYVQAKEGNENK